MKLFKRFVIIGSILFVSLFASTATAIRSTNGHASNALSANALSANGMPMSLPPKTGQKTPAKLRSIEDVKYLEYGDINEPDKRNKKNI